MSNTRDTGFLRNAIQVTDQGVTFVSGSTTLMSISSSGAVTTTGVISGSNALSASFSLNSALLNGIGSVGFATTGALLEVSSSQQQISSSQQQISASLLNVVANYATTGSNSFRANQSITGSLVVSSTITAQTLVVQTVTSSIVYSSGSNIFGNQSTNTQTFTGSILTSGNIGLGITPSAWNGIYRVFQIDAGSISSSPSYNNISVGANVFYNAGNSPRYIVNDYATLYGQDDGLHAWYTAPSGTAGAAMTFTQSMTLTAAGNLGVGTTSPAYTLDVNGTTPMINIQAGANTNARGIQFNYNGAMIVGSLINYGATGENALSAGSSGTSGYFLTFKTDGTERIRITSTGNVGIGTSTIYSGAKLQIVGGLLAVEPTNGNTNIEITLGRGLSSLGTSAGSGITSKINFAFEGSNDNFYQEAGFVTTTANQTRINSAADFYVSTKAAGASSPTEKFRITSAGYVNIGYTFNQNYGKLNVLSSGQQLYNGITVYTSGGTDSFIGLGCNDSTAGVNVTYGSSGAYLPFVAIVAGSERIRVTTTGGFGIGTTSVTGTTRLRAINSSAVNGDPLLFVDNAVYNALGIYSAGADGYNGAACVMIMGRNTTNSRSINAGGSINASGTDYAEYMTKATTDAILKGDIVGVNSNGLLTNIFADSKSFVVKSTDPSYVGGDTWGNVDDIGKLQLDATDEQKTEHEAKVEAARAKVDRIAFSGQVPCNVTGATVGDYIIPIELENGKISGQAVTNPTFEQYQISVGKVWKIMEDGRAWIAVKIG